MRTAASPAWEFGNPCRWRRRPHGNLGIHAGGGVTRMGIWESMQVAASPAWEFWESMQAAASPAWEFGNPCKQRGHPHGNFKFHADGRVSRMEKIESPGT